jgi:hypothetical protein
MLSALEALTQAKELIADQTHWGRGAYSLTGPDGVTRFCAVGALQHVCGAHHIGVYGRSHTLLWNCADELYKLTPVGVNDSLQHEDVMKIYDCAIKDAKERNV